MDRWDIILLAAAAYLSVVPLVRLMAGRRNQLISDVRAQVRGASDAPSSGKADDRR